MNNTITTWVLRDGLRQPRPPKPHIMRHDGWWYLVDPPFGTWRGWKLPRTDPRKHLPPASGV